jgi:hypothetical protein
MAFNLSPGIPYLTLGTYEQIKWVTEDIDSVEHYLYEPTRSEIDTALTWSDPLEELPRLYIIQLKDFSVNTEYGLPKYKHQTINPDNYYFFICALPCGDIKFQEGYKVIDRASVVKQLSSRPYKTLDLRKVDYNIPQTQDLKEKKILEFHSPFPYTLQRKLKGGWGLGDDTDWSFSAWETNLIEALNTKEGFLLWGSITDSQMYEYFTFNSYGEYRLFDKAEASGLSFYLCPFLELQQQSPIRLPFKNFLSRFAQWVYFSHKYWATSSSPGLYSYTPKSGKRKIKGVEKAYMFKPSFKARQEWVRIVQGKTPCLSSTPTPKDK